MKALCELNAIAGRFQMVRFIQMRTLHPLLAILFVLCACAVCLQSAAAGQERESPALGKIKRATSVFIDCSACPRALAKAGTTAEQELTNWKRFRIVTDPKQTDLIFLFSANPYMGDYLSRKGPDTRPARIDGVILTVIDPRTGEKLWSDSRKWGSWRIPGATTDLIAELRGDLEAESRVWTVDDVFRCSGTPVYQIFAFLTPDAALTKSVAGVSRMEKDPGRLRIGSPDAPEFCRRAQLFVGPDGKIAGFEVVVSESENLDVADILEEADRFQFTSGRDPQTQRVYFTAQSRDRRVVIEFQVQGHRMVLTRVRYAY